VDASHADVVCIQETKIAAMQQWTLLSALGSCFSDFLELPAMGASGGILIACKRNVMTTGNCRVNNHSALVQFCLENGVAWWLTCVYGPQRNNVKIAFLQTM
jgi:uncharacterized membrane protein